MKLIKKEVFVDEIENNEGCLEEVMDDMEKGDTIYFICQENPAGSERGQFEIRAVMTPIDFDPSNYDDEYYSTTLEAGGAINLPLKLVQEMGWKEGDEIEITETSTEDMNGNEVKGIVLNKKADIDGE